MNSVDNKGRIVVSLNYVERRSIENSGIEQT